MFETNCAKHASEAYPPYYMMLADGWHPHPFQNLLFGKAQVHHNSIGRQDIAQIIRVRSLDDDVFHISSYYSVKCKDSNYPRYESRGMTDL